MREMELRRIDVSQAIVGALRHTDQRTADESLAYAASMRTLARFLTTEADLLKHPLSCAGLSEQALRSVGIETTEDLLTIAPGLFDSLRDVQRCRAKTIREIGEYVQRHTSRKLLSGDGATPDE